MECRGYDKTNNSFKDINADDGINKIMLLGLISLETDALLSSANTSAIFVVTPLDIT